MLVIGIDPGSQRTGWGVVAEHSGVLELVDCGIIRATARPDFNFSARLSFIYRELACVLARLQPEEAAIEEIFTARNAASALKLGQARGVAVAACAASGMRVFDYEPTVVKKSIVGVGRAEKEQVAFMVGRLLNTRTAKLPLDTTDALGLAICHLNLRRFATLCQKDGQAVRLRSGG